MQQTSLAAARLRDVPRTRPEVTIRAATRLVSSKVGIIRSIGRGINHAQDPRCLSLGIAGPDLARVYGVANSTKAGGAGESLESALAATIGEAVERYCTWLCDPADMTFGTYAELSDEAVHPTLLRLYSEAQCKSDHSGRAPEYFTEDSRINWVRGVSLSTGRTRLVPASLVYLGYEYQAGEARIGRNASSGLAAGGTLEEAILSALYECVERDAFTISWLCRIAGSRVQIDDAAIAARMRDRFWYGHNQIEMEFFDITLDIPIPSFFAYMVRPSEFGPTLSVSSVTRRDPRDCALKALHEMSQFLPYARFLNIQLSDWQPDPAFENLTTFDHHCMTYVKRPELIDPALAPYRRAPKTVPISEIPGYGARTTVLGEIEYCVSALMSRGFEVVVVDITTPDVEDVGLKVVRVLVPGLANLHANHRFPYLGCTRIHAVNESFHGMQPGPPLNALPHPFP